MFKYAFVSRHTPTPEQVALAEKAGIELVPVGDLDAFTIDAEQVWAKCPNAVGAVVVHPAAAVRLLFSGLPVGVYENANRAAVGEPPRFEAKALHLFSTDCDPYWVDWLEESGLCPAGYRTKKEAEAVELFGELPPLTGSTKQVAWAERIRRGTIIELQKEVEHANSQEFREYLIAVSRRILSERTEAKWWIDTQHEDLLDFCKQYAK